MRRAGACLAAVLTQGACHPARKPTATAWAWRAKHTSTLGLEQRGPARVAPANAAKKPSLADVRARSVFVVNSEGVPNTSPVLLGLTDALTRSHPSSPIGFYQPIAGAPFPGAPPGAPPRHAALLAAAFPPPTLLTAAGMPRADVVRALAEGRDDDVIQAAADGWEGLVGRGVGAAVVEGAHEEAAAAWARAAGAAGGDAGVAPPPNLPSVRLSLNARLAAALGVRVLVVVDAAHDVRGVGGARAGPPSRAALQDAAFEVATRAAVAVRALRRARAEVLGVVVNHGDDGQTARALAAAAAPRLAAAGTRLLGVLPTDPALAAGSLGDVAGALGARCVSGHGTDACNAPVSAVLVAGGSASGTVGDAVLAASRSPPSLRPDATSKISAAINLWRASIPDGALEEAVAAAGAPHPPADPPGRFISRIFAAASTPPPGQPLARIVLPESGDARVLAAAVEIARRRIAVPVLLGRPAAVRASAAAAGLGPAFADAERQGADGASAGLVILDRDASPDAVEAAAAALAAARAHAGVSLEAARATIAGPDLTWFGTALVAAGSADGLVSGAVHTTADTVRPALHLLRGSGRVPSAAPGGGGGGRRDDSGSGGAPAAPTAGLVSSLFFMCLPSGVVAYADCALCVEPGPADLAAIALASARTAAAFGLGGGGGAGAAAGPGPPIRVALLSYATHGSGTGPAVDRVREAAAIAAAAAPPGVAVDGPLQYDAATDPAVAATKLGGSPGAAGGSAVAGRANVLVFPSLEAGNIAYKAAQAAAGAVVVGPLLQGLSLGVANDLSRGCAVPDIVCTVAATVLQARALKGDRGGTGGPPAAKRRKGVGLAAAAA